MEQFANISINTRKFSNNFAFFFGGGICAYTSPSDSIFQIANSIFTDDYSLYAGGAMYFELLGNISIKNSKFINNSASLSSGNIYAFNSQENTIFEITGCVFNNNSSPYYHGGAIFLQLFGNFSLNTCNFSNNFAFFKGGAIYSFASHSNSMIQIKNSIFTNQSSSGGGAII